MKHLLFSICTVWVLAACSKDNTDTVITTKIDQSCSAAKKMTETAPLQAEKIATAALHLAEQNRYGKGRASALYVLGIANAYQGKYGIATDSYMKAIRIQEQVGDQQGLARTYNALGIAYQYCTLYQNAEEAFQKGQQIAETVDDTETKAKINRALGVLYQVQGKYMQASDYYRISLRLFQTLNSVYTGLVYNDLAVVQEMYPNPDYKAILNLYQQALEVQTKYNSQEGIGLALFNMGRMQVKLGNNQTALSYIQQAEAYFKNDAGNMVLALNEKAEVLMGMSQLENAKTVLSKAETLIPSLLGIDKEKGLRTYQLAKMVYVTSSSDLQKFTQKEAAMENEIKAIRQSITIDQLKEQSKAYQVQTSFLIEAIEQAKTDKIRLMVAASIIVLLLFFVIYLLLRYRKLFRLFKEYVLSRDEVLGRFSPE